ncbi:MAG: beta-aspartyl-peptidase [Maricaulis sp.]|nr:beta-aspartyl-peptidase [Maricaulis sp.]
MLHLITNAELYAPARLGPRHILVAGNKIIYVGEKLPELDPCLDVQVVDVEGAPVIPGIIDAHAHIVGGGGESGPASRVPPLALSAFTLAGVTSVVGVLGTDDLTRNTQTLVTQVYGLREQGISAWCHTGGYHYPLMTLTGSARSDIVNIDPVIGVGELALSDHRSSQPTLDEFLRVASEAHVAGLMTGKAGIVHCHLGDGKRGLEMLRAAIEQSELPSRVFNPTHVNRNRQLFEEALEITKHGCVIDLTAFPADDVGPGYSATEAFLRYREASCPPAQLTISSDGGGCLPQFDTQGNLTQMGIGSSSTLMATLREVAAQGVPLGDILPAMTSNVGDLLRFSTKGRLQKGKDADLIVLSDELEVRDVMAMGQWHVRDGRAFIVGTYENG